MFPTTHGPGDTQPESLLTLKLVGVEPLYGGGSVGVVQDVVGRNLIDGPGLCQELRLWL